jgi:uncharacterized MnhB-related membrane protein
MAASLELAFDLIPAVTLLWLAGAVVRSKGLFPEVVLFIAYGLLMALAWVRLQAPDIASPRRPSARG